MIQRICIVSREYDGVAGAGGLKDVVRGLAEALADTGREVTVLIPRYSFLASTPVITELKLMIPGTEKITRIVEMRQNPVRVVAIDHPVFSSKHGIYTYHRSDAPSADLVGKGHMDVDVMNAVLQEAAVRYMMSLDTAPDIIHAHDAHTGLIGSYLKYLAPDFFSKTGLLTTIHNAGIAYQQIAGSLDKSVKMTGLPESLLRNGVLDNQLVPFLVSSEYGLLNTVSPGYAEELINGKDIYSGKLGPELKQRKVKLKGIINGLDADYWSGRPDSKIEARDRILRNLNEPTRHCNSAYGDIEISGELPAKDSVWILFHGRLTYQKGLDDVLALASGHLDSRKDYHIIIYGQGDPNIESAAAETASSMNNWTFLRGYDESLTLDLFRASSWVIVPSRWEPCGQIDMIGQLLGALPVVRRVGGLKKVLNRFTGLSYGSLEDGGLEKKLQLALDWETKRPGKVWRMRQRAENTIYERRSWRKVLVRGYLPLYRKARKTKRKIQPS